MNWKEFLKPNSVKIIILTILSVVFVPFINYDTGIRCIQAPCSAAFTGSFLMYLLFSHNFYVYYFSYVNLILGLIVSYLISCLIIFLINKNSKRRIFEV